MFWEFFTCFSCIRSCFRFFDCATAFFSFFFFCFGLSRLSGSFFALFQVCICCSSFFFDLFYDLLVSFFESRFFFSDFCPYQLGALMVDHNRCFDVPFADVLSIDDFLSPLLVRLNLSSVFVVVFSYSHEDVFVMCLPDFWLGKPPCLVQ